MTVLEKKTKLPVEVYDIRYDNHGYPIFLYYQNGQWFQKSAKYFVPLRYMEFPCSTCTTGFGGADANGVVYTCLDTCVKLKEYTKYNTK